MAFWSLIAGIPTQSGCSNTFPIVILFLHPQTFCAIDRHTIVPPFNLKEDNLSYGELIQCYLYNQVVFIVLYGKRLSESHLQGRFL